MARDWTREQAERFHGLQQRQAHDHAAESLEHFAPRDLPDWIHTLFIDAETVTAFTGIAKPIGLGP
jgi:hypothetical protein